MTIETPCIRTCRLDEAGVLCLGCGRTGAEIAAWGTYAPGLRRSIMAALPMRLARHRLAPQEG